MIVYVYGELFYSPARVFLNPVNTVGTMGGDIDGDFKRFYPEMYNAYQLLCEQDQLDIGQFYLYQTAHKWIVNVPIRKHFRANPRLEYIQDAIQKLALHASDLGITSLSMPALAWDELAWDDVRPILEGILGNLPMMTYIHMPEAPKNMPTRNQPPRNVRAIRSWLQSIPHPVTYDGFIKDIQKLTEQQSHWQTTSKETFRVRIISTSGKKQLSMKITPTKHNPIFLSETALRDLWRYIQRSGYIFPQDLPAGLDANSAYIITILAQLPYCLPVYLAKQNDVPQLGLHYIPPINRQRQTQVIDADAFEVIS